MIKGYPLQWPFGWKRTTARKPGQFRSVREIASTGGGYYKRATELSVSEAIERVTGQLRMLGIGRDDFVISTNLPLRLDGLPRSDARRPEDPGAAVYFKLKGKDRVLACDKWTEVAANIAAIAAHIEALRGQERWGVGSLDRAFTGYDALPPPGPRAERPWQDVLYPGVEGDLDLQGGKWSRALVERAYRALLGERHPDRGGSHEQAAELNRAVEQARRELGA